MKKELSRLRQGLRALEERRAELFRRLLSERPRLIRGTFGTRRRVCGNPNCKCTRGELHESKYLSATVEGRTRQVHVPAGDEAVVAEGVRRYRLWNRGRAKLAELNAKHLKLLDALVELLLKPYPPNAPIPPPRKRGPKPKGDDGTS